MNLETITPTGLIFDGWSAKINADVYNWHDTGLETVIGGNNKARTMRQDIDLFVVHWTGGYGDAEQLFNVLNRRALGVEYFIDYEGRIVQYCDPLIVNTADAGFVNPRSVGVEVQCRGFPPKKAGRGVPGQKAYSDRIRGRSIHMLDFTKAQKRSLDALITAHREHEHRMLTIPRTLPRNDRGGLLRDTMTRREVRNYSGVIGHYHISKRKTDPGTAPLLYLDGLGYR